MIVCVCHQISDRDITRHVQAGRDLSDIQLELGVATPCGRCEGCAREVVERCQSRALSVSPTPEPGCWHSPCRQWSPACS